MHHLLPWGVTWVPASLRTGGRAEMPLHRRVAGDRAGGGDELSLNPLYASTAERTPVPKRRIPQVGLDPDIAYQVVRDELILDGNSRLNLATFVTTWMEPQAERLMAVAADKNIVDKDEYPQSAEIERRCVDILADLWHAPAEGGGVGTSTTGSSEAAMLAGMAMKWRWRQRAGGAGGNRPNLVLGSNAQICWEKFCRYWEVEPRLVPMQLDRLHLTADEAVRRCDENTIGVVAILGSTQDGSFEPVAEIGAALDALESGGGPSIPVHVDAASGGFVAPFVQPDLEWDFRVPRVASINASGHKYGLVYPGVGWVVWRRHEDLPDDLVFHVNYLGGMMPTFSLNFSRPGAQVIAQYYCLLRLGFEGYRRVHQAALDVAAHLSSTIARLGPFELLSDGHELPVFAFRLKQEVTRYTVFDVSEALRKHGWQVPAYNLPPDVEDVAVLRIVVRNGMSRDLADALLADLRHEITLLEHLPAPIPSQYARHAFHH